VGQQHGDVLAGAGGREHHVVHAELLHPVQTGCFAVPVGVHDDLGAAAQCTIGDGVNITHDQVRAHAVGQSAGSCAVDPYQQGAVLSHVGGEHGEVFLVRVPAHHDQNVASFDLGPYGRNPDAVEQQLPCPAHIVHCVRREGFQ